MGFRKYLVPFSIAVLVMIYPLRGGDTLGLGFLPSALALALMGLAFVIRPQGRFVLVKSDILVLAYLLLALVSALVSGISDISLRYLFQIAALSMLPYVVIRGGGFSFDEAKKFLQIFPYINLFTACSMTAIVGPEQLMSYSGYRLGSEALNPVGIGYAFGVSTLITVAGLRLRACGLIVGLLSIAVSVIILVLSGSRGAMLAMAVALLFRGSIWRMVAALCVLAMSGYLAFGMLSQVMVSDRFFNVTDSTSVQARFASWTQALTMFDQRPLLGHGLGAYEALHGEYVHNVVLEHLANGGLALTIPFLLLVLVIMGNVVAGLAGRLNEMVMILALLGIYAFIVRLFSLSMANTKDIFLFLAMALSCAQSLQRSPSRLEERLLADIRQDKTHRATLAE